MHTETSLGGFPRRIPATMATQHPDNAAAPAWSPRSDGRITLEMETEEAFRNFSLGAQETMWDNEGKHADYGIGLKLVETYQDYFSEHQLGRDAYITYRIPNRWRQKGGIQRHALTAIAAENETLADYGFYPQAFFEVILPFTDDQYQLLGVQMDYILNNSGKRVPEFLEIIPLIEGPARLGHLDEILAGYVEGMQRIWGIRPHYVRPFAARSDPAMDAGLVAADLFVLGAASEFAAFAQDSGISVYPIIGAGAAGFRGGLQPLSVDRFVQKYPGYATATIQSAFRYDYAEAEVRAGIARLAELLPEAEQRVLADSEMATVLELMQTFSAPYRATVTQREDGRMPVADAIVQIADRYIPSHRERANHVGVFGYARSMENADDVNFPRAIKYVAAFMSLGVPPDLVGVGRGLTAARERGLLGELERLLPFLRDDLAGALRYVDLHSLDRLASTSEAWATIRDDVLTTAGYVGEPPGPRSAAEQEHVVQTTRFVTNYLDGCRDEDEMTADAVRAAHLRRYLG
jgi:phosphoenolpyruvate carboxylase